MRVASLLAHLGSTETPYVRLAGVVTIAVVVMMYSIAVNKLSRIGVVRWSSALFGALLVFWIAPGFHGETSLFGLAHGLGFIALALLIWAAILRHEAPYTLLAATLTPVGPVGSVIAIHYIERRQPAPE